MYTELSFGKRKSFFYDGALFPATSLTHAYCCASLALSFVELVSIIFPDTEQLVTILGVL